MSKSRRGIPLSGLRQAFDEVRFGAERTLNLRALLPTPDQATTRAEAWLRERQMSGATEVLVITGRGNNSEGGTSPVREAVIRHLHVLTRKGVVASHAEHTPGSFVVELAPVSQLWDAPKRRRDKRPVAPPATPPSLEALDEESRTLLRNLAVRSLDALGVVHHETFIEGEMLRQFGAIAASIPPGSDRDAALRRALRVALDQYE